jgi:hypothetical protein
VPPPDDSFRALPVIGVLLMGVLIQFVLARFMSKRGFVNGFVVMIGVDCIRTMLQNITYCFTPFTDPMHNWAKRTLDFDSRSLAFTAIATALIVAATCIALRPSRNASGNLASAAAASSAYRNADSVTLRPWLPVPAGSMQAYLIAFAVYLPVKAPRLVSAPLAEAGIQASSFGRMLPVQLLLSVGLAWLLARAMYRPAALAALCEQLGAKSGPEFHAELRAERRSVFWPTLLFLVTLCVAQCFAFVQVVMVALMVPLVLDLLHAARLRLRAPDLVVVWEERRIVALPMLRAVLTTEGIASETRGTYYLQLMQFFAPYAPAELLVAQADAKRARKTLRHLLAGGEAPQRSAQIANAPPEPAPWSRTLQTGLLAGCAALALLTYGCAQVAMARPNTPILAPPAPHTRTTLEIVRVDDTVNAFAHINESAIPESERINVWAETISSKDEPRATTQYAKMVVRAGESKADAIARFSRWLSGIALPTGKRFGIEEIHEYDEQTKTSTLVGLRTFVLTGDPALTTADVTDAVALDDHSYVGAEPTVQVTLSPRGAQRFEDVTREWQNRRLAIVLDGVIDSAPLVRAAIAGGHVSLSMGTGDRPQLLKNAEHLARALRGH